MNRILRLCLSATAVYATLLTACSGSDVPVAANGAAGSAGTATVQNEAGSGGSTNPTNGRGGDNAGGGAGIQNEAGSGGSLHPTNGGGDNAGGNAGQGGGPTNANFPCNPATQFYRVTIGGIGPDGKPSPPGGNCELLPATCAGQTPSCECVQLPCGPCTNDHGAVTVTCELG